MAAAIPFSTYFLGDGSSSSFTLDVVEDPLWFYSTIPAFIYNNGSGQTSILQYPALVRQFSLAEKTISGAGNLQMIDGNNNSGKVTSVPSFTIVDKHTISFSLGYTPANNQPVLIYGTLGFA